MPLSTTKFVSVLDCPDPRALAGFYRDLLGWTTAQDDDHWVELARDDANSLAFQRAPDFTPARWPSESVHVHLDFYVPEFEDAERLALELGATRVDDPSSTKDFRVYRDPAGHHFCLCVEPVGLDI
ncbi:VOC family protein [Rhodococcus sp. (in: high G+C Gram-positive bacteria)]|uniref:VOC family protein n=1 Tax=Rhodococcus sp. TaxID=1831 RepID=UPI00388E2F22